MILNFILLNKNLNLPQKRAQTPHFIKHMRVMYGAQTGTCLCSRDFTVEEVRKMVKTTTGKNTLWGGISESCDIEDKSFEAFTKELNKMFKKWNV